MMYSRIFASYFFFFSSRRRHTRCSRDWSSDVCSSDLNQSELTATIDACNKSNVAIYAVDARGLVTTAPAGSSRNRAVSSKARAVAASFRTPAPRSSSRVRLVLAAYPAMGMPDPQRPGGGGGGPPSGGGGGGAGGGGRGRARKSRPASHLLCALFLTEKK